MKENIHYLSHIINTVKKSNDYKTSIEYIFTTGAFFITKIMRLLNY
jgi:hypothetical protein